MRRPDVEKKQRAFVTYVRRNPKASAQHLSRRFNIAKTTVSKWRKRFGLETRKGRSQALKDEVLIHAKQNPKMPTREISEKYDIHLHTVYAWLAVAGPSRSGTGKNETTPSWPDFLTVGLNAVVNKRG